MNKIKFNKTVEHMDFGNLVVTTVAEINDGPDVLIYTQY